MKPTTTHVKQSLGFCLGHDATSLHRKMLLLYCVSSEASELLAPSVWCNFILVKTGGGVCSALCDTLLLSSEETQGGYSSRLMLWSIPWWAALKVMAPVISLSLSLSLAQHLSKSHIENRRCSEGCIIADACWKKLRKTEVSCFSRGSL